MSTVIEVFVSSPGDLTDERKVVAEVVGKLTTAAHVRRGYALRAHLYEEVVPPVLADGPQDAVNTFMMDPARCDVLVCLLGDRLGTPMKDPADPERTFRSGTEYELTRACKSSKRPRPQALIYYRRTPRESWDAQKRAEVDALVAGIRRGDGPFRGIAPAAFDDGDDLGRKLTDHLDEVVTLVMRLYARRRFQRWLAGLATAVAIAAVGYFAWGQAGRAGYRTGVDARQPEIDGLVRALREDAERRTQAQAQALLDGVMVGLLQKVGDLDTLGCGVAAPLLHTLGQLQARGDVESAGAIVRALTKLAARNLREGCGCTQLLAVLATENLTVRYCKSTHELVLHALGNLSCPNKREVLCNFLRKIGPDPSFTSVLCEGERPVNLVELSDLALTALGRQSCAQAAGIPP